MKIILIYSGGLDSTTLLYQLRGQGFEVRCLCIDYGQRHKRELKAAANICDELSQDCCLLDIKAVKSILGGSALIDESIDIPKGQYTVSGMKDTVVPNRNMIFISLAISWAISTKSEAVAYAAHGGDHAVYPDCRPEFVRAMSDAATVCDWNTVELKTPFLTLSKADIVRLGASLSVPFSKTWSCYEGGEIHCGRCSTCTERKGAFIQAGVNDPTVYAD